EHPVGRAAWIVGEIGSQVETAAGGRAARVHARDRAAGAVGRRVIDAAVAADRDDGVGFGDVDGHVAALVVVVGAACEHPVGRAAWIVGEAGPQVEAAAGGRAARVHARDRAAGAVGGRVIDA